MYNPLKPQTAVPDSDEDDEEGTPVPTEIQVRFWKLVAALNVAILLFALGVLFLVFRGLLLVGGGTALVGALLLAYCAVDYRRAKARIAEINANRNVEDGDVEDKDVEDRASEDRDTD